MADDAEAPEPPLPEMAPARPPDYNAIRNYSFDDLLMHQTPDKKLTIFNKAGSSVMRSRTVLICFLQCQANSFRIARSRSLETALHT